MKIHTVNADFNRCELVNYSAVKRLLILRTEIIRCQVIT